MAPVRTKRVCGSWKYPRMLSLGASDVAIDQKMQTQKKASELTEAVSDLKIDDGTIRRSRHRYRLRLLRRQRLLRALLAVPAAPRIRFRSSGS